MRVDTVIDTINQTELIKKNTTSSTGTTEYDSNDFMQMLMAQLTHQNPMEPMNDSEMMAQFTQLNSLQQLQQIESAMQQVMLDSQTSYASNLIGKVVVIKSSDDTSKEGKVTGFSVENGNVQVQVDGENYSLDEVVKVQEETVNG